MRITNLPAAVGRLAEALSQRLGTAVDGVDLARDDGAR